MAGYYSEIYFLQKMFNGKMAHLNIEELRFFQRNSQFLSPFNNGDS